ncbi:uncharacterized protein LOC116234841 [Phasianus colchicus]|uniref:uncharacterized protein LOC116234841 n=1 Tax=Phasianus colchicus TaxID=9054 RepID=UPI00129E7FE0|nr:uncharacterized protein LOC116234841 [Phasianus colchicus]
MATELDRRCPICLDSMDDASYVMPCLHQFCFGCIRRWAESRPTCPLCKRRVESILHSVRADDSFQEVVVGQQERARTAPRQAAPAQEPPAVPISRQPPAVLRPLLPWLRQELGQLFGADHRAAAAAQRRVISGLCLFGLDGGALTLWLFGSLRSQTASFVRRLVVQAAYACNGLVQRVPGPEASRAATGQEGSRAAARGAAASQAQTPQPSSSTGEDNVEEEHPVPSTAALSEGPSQPPSLPAPSRTGQQAAQEEPGEAVPGPSSTNRARERSRRAPRRAPKRRAQDSGTSAPPAKRPPRRQH